MTLGELIHSLDKDEVLDKLKELYQGPGEDLEGYQEVWEKLKVMQPENTTISVQITKRQYFLDGQDYIHVSGIKPNDPQTYAIKYVPWEQWLSMEITTDLNLTDIEKVAHCLYEMTWAGYNQETIAEQIEEINDRVEEVKENYTIDKNLN